FGVLPLAIASGPGQEMRQALGTSVVFGMIGVTIFGLIFTPVFYVVCRRLAERLPGRKVVTEPPPEPGLIANPAPEARS
ncbi:MAG: efflux RND transporter permease subunit, partial [Brevundimonas sp.]